jgi:predicted DNA-binding ribbon-helix-helix protein
MALARVGWRRRGPPIPAVANGRARLVLMPLHVQPRRIIINGRPTSIRLEPAFWGWLREIAAECGMTAKALIEGIFLAKSANCPLSSALRLHIADYFYRQAPHTGLVDPESRLAFRIERPRKSRKGG